MQLKLIQTRNNIGNKAVTTIWSFAGFKDKTVKKKAALSEPISLQDLENSARLQTAKTNTDKDMEIEHTGEIKTFSFLHCAPYLIQFFNNARQGLQKAWKVLDFVFQQFSLSKCELNKISKRYYESNSVFNHVIFVPQINLLTSLHHLTEHELHIFSFHEQFAWLLTRQEKNFPYMPDF